MNENDLEVAEKIVTLARDQRVKSVRALVSGTGRDTCVDCDATISPERREAAPFAERCIACQRKAERERELHAR